MVNLGLAVAGTYLIFRKKNRELALIERSEFYRLMKRIKLHPQTQRRDGFYKITYQFGYKPAKGTAVEATVHNYRPSGRIALKDSLEITIHTKRGSTTVRLQVVAKPLLEIGLLPLWFKNGLLGSYTIESDSPLAETENAFGVLSQVLDLAKDTNEADKT